jgi:hypothetical protein
MEKLNNVAKSTETKQMSKAGQAKVAKLVEANNQKMLAKFKKAKKAKKQGKEADFIMSYINTNGKKFELNKTQSMVFGRILELKEIQKANGKLKKGERKCLINAEDKLEVRGIMNVYRKLKKLSAQEKRDLLGATKFPTVAEYCEGMPNKAFFSLWDGLNFLSSLHTEKK